MTSSTEIKKDAAFYYSRDNAIYEQWQGGHQLVCLVHPDANAVRIVNLLNLSRDALAQQNTEQAHD